MPKFANKLDELLADAVLANGVQRQVALEVVRKYLQTTPLQQLKMEVSQVVSLTELRFLQAAGVPSGLQEVFLTVYQSLSGKLS
jgi:hypothetical protein